MTILDPVVEVLCDGQGCHETVFISTVYRVGGYDVTKSEAAIELDNAEWWSVGGKHFCPSCAEEEPDCRNDETIIKSGVSK